jgi:hypothetical protein
MSDQITYFQANVKLGTTKRTGTVKVKPKFTCSGNVCFGNVLTFPLVFPAGTKQSSLANVENTNIQKGDQIDVELTDPDNGAIIGTATGTVTDPINNNVVECLIYG